MLARILSNSVESESLDESYGMDYISTYTTSSSRVSIVSRDPFVRGDCLELEQVSNSPLFIGEKMEVPPETVGFLVPIITNVPLHPDVEYDFNASKGSDIVLVDRSVHQTTPLASYIILVRSKSEEFQVRGKDKTFGDEIIWYVDLSKELEKYS